MYPSMIKIHISDVKVRKKILKGYETSNITEHPHKYKYINKIIHPFFW